MMKEIVRRLRVRPRYATLAVEDEKKLLILVRISNFRIPKELQQAAIL